MSESTTPTCFFAYPSKPLSLGENIETAKEIINSSEVIEIISWKDIHVTGKIVINEILDAINKADLFACDLTFPNPNVLFELGYAVARNKRIWITLLKTLENWIHKANSNTSAQSAELSFVFSRSHSTC